MLRVARGIKLDAPQNTKIQTVDKPVADTDGAVAGAHYANENWAGVNI